MPFWSDLFKLFKYSFAPDPIEAAKKHEAEGALAALMERVAAMRAEAHESYMKAMTEIYTAKLRGMMKVKVNPIHPKPAWASDPAVVAVATIIHQKYEVSSVPVLADALEDAGCEAALLEKIREKVPCCCERGAVYDYQSRAPELDWVVCPLCGGNGKRHRAFVKVLATVIPGDYIDLRRYSWHFPSDRKRVKIEDSKYTWEQLKELTDDL